MGKTTKIEWCDSTWSPISGCTHGGSPGCDFCYAAAMAKRFWGNRKFSDIQFHPDRLEQPLKWKKPKRIFVASMGDLFHKDVSVIWIDSILNIIRDCPQHIFMLLTKRPENIEEKLFAYYHNKKRKQFSDDYLPKNVWLGCTCENQEMADKRIPILLEIPATIHFVSIEPMLSEINLNKPQSIISDRVWIKPYIDRLDLVICGTESGPKRRPAKIKWIRNLKDQCVNANIAFFLKQTEINGKVVKMPELDGKVWNRMSIIKE